jgi:agmatine deiminase
MLGEVERVLRRDHWALYNGQKIKLLVRDPESEAGVSAALDRAGIALSQIVFVSLATEDSWIRDYGPIFVVNSAQRQLGMVNAIFNAWGNKYDDLIGDDRIPAN